MFDPFDIDNESDYRIWRERKLQDYPERLDQLVIEINDPLNLSVAEHEALLQRCKKTNFVIYQSPVTGENKNIPVRLGQQFGLMQMDHNWLADDDAVTSLTVSDEGDHPRYIPYTNRSIKWHTDGYYNDADRQVYGLLLHCVRPAEQGGENRLLDQDIAYIKLRDSNPDFIRALMQPDAMTIPERNDESGVARPAVSGPVFSLHSPSGSLHMRYTARTRSIHWKQDDLTRQAVRCLEDLLESDMPYIFSGRLEAGMGLVSNNVLHDRSAFIDGDRAGRLLYRVRYYDRIRDTGVEDS